MIQLDFFYEVDEMDSLIQELEKVDKSLVNVNRNLQGKIAQLRERIEKKLQISTKP